MAEKKCKCKTDKELKIYLKEIGVDIKNGILHSYRPSSEGICVNCDYYTLRCWLCDQCISCCKLTEQEKESTAEQKIF